MIFSWPIPLCVRGKKERWIALGSLVACAEEDRGGTKLIPANTVVTHELCEGSVQ